MGNSCVVMTCEERHIAREPTTHERERSPSVHNSTHMWHARPLPTGHLHTCSLLDSGSPDMPSTTMHHRLRMDPPMSSSALWRIWKKMQKHTPCATHIARAPLLSLTEDPTTRQ